jgi:macrolide transport system ATP-binding/permease protein
MVIQADQLERAYHKYTVTIFALRAVNLRIEEGEFTAIMGPSGSGKSTLLHLLGCLDRPSAGQYWLDGINVAELDDRALSHIRNHKIGFIFQSFNLLPQHTVLQNIETPLLYASSDTDDLTAPSSHPSPVGLTNYRAARRQRTARAQHAAEQVGLGHRLHHRSSELSGGEMQRVAVARALVTRPRVILADEPTGNLDSRTGRDIMQLLRTLHQHGHTIILVTHEQAIAEYADRIIFLKDGRIERDTANDQRSVPTDRQPTASSRQPAADSHLTAVLLLLPLILDTALRGVLLHKLRSFLSVLGIVFGIGAIIAMLAIGAGAKQEIIEQIALLGTNTITIKAAPPSDELAASGSARLSQGLTDRDVERIARVSPFITHLAAVRKLAAAVQYQRQAAQATIVGTTPAYRYTGNLTLRRGRFLTPADVQDKQRVCVLGAEIQQALFAFQNPVGRLVKIRSDWFRVIGVLENKALNRDEISAIQPDNVNKHVYIPLSTAADFLPPPESTQVQEISIRVDTPQHVDDVARIVRSVLTRVHHGAEDYEVIVPRELLKQSQQAQQVFNLVMGSIAGISLLVGGIGIMNIMLATVTERTKEIGIRRAIGASRQMILVQFLIETLLLTIVGGCLGILLGVGGAFLISRLAEWRTVISAQTVLLAVSISTLIGIVFGLYPASQGARMDPIAALRYE